MTRYLSLILFLLIFSCKEKSKSDEAREPISESETVISNPKTDDDLSAISTKDFREFKVLDSKVITKSEIWSIINPELEDFKDADYNKFKSLILEADIPTLQKLIEENKLSYQQLVKFYLFRIRKFDRENKLSLNSVISINPNVIKQAKEADETEFEQGMHPIFGMPILLKDNINAKDMVTTAGAVALKNNKTDDAFLVTKLKSKGALILGKANLSEWAYFFCGDCPSGYSAVGGQTLNPYGRRIIDTGGSSSGSGVSVSANFAVAAIGSETSGSILSPASSNSVVGLKPTIGLVSRSGIVPISSTLDTAGPMTKSVIDNAILLDAIFGADTSDSKTIDALIGSGFYYNNIEKSSVKGKRLGVPKRLLQDTLYIKALDVLKKEGAVIVEFDEEEVGLPNFLRLLNLDMKKDLPAYMDSYADKAIKMRSIEDFMTYNLQDSLITMPYGQSLFKGIKDDKGDTEFLAKIQKELKANGKQYFDKPMQALKLDGFLSINNYHAGFAAVAEYPALTVPMGYKKDNTPMGLTFISTRLCEKQLLEWAYVYEKASKMRIAPKDYN
ncbi:amidase family protein [uncultured Algibacter sp.]|uniref:amidase family protein n=1 Tax=uncultured Algibacter sp. TaxID=298659 RepID=UPI00321759F1